MVPENFYVSQQDLWPFPCGIRIDYVLYKVPLLLLTCCLYRSVTNLCHSSVQLV
jgi:sphingomyelin phosphodiesterase 2